MEPKCMKYNDVVKLAAHLCGTDMLPDGMKEEYMRGQVELICDIFGIPMDDREQVVNDMQNVDPYGMVNPDWDDNKSRFWIAIRGHEPDDTEHDGIWTHKLVLTDNKYIDSDRFPVHAIAAGDSWPNAYKRAGEMMAEAAATDHCIF